jgi:hypothetical protein
VYGNSKDENVIKKKSQKILKYQDLSTETQLLWISKLKLLPVKIGATENISK